MYDQIVPLSQEIMPIFQVFRGSDINADVLKEEQHYTREGTDPLNNATALFSMYLCEIATARSL